MPRHKEGKAPEYETVARMLRARIESGAYPQGMPLPTEQALAAEFDKSRNTIRRALEILRGEGLVITRRTRGTVVRTEMPRRPISMARYQSEVDRLLAGRPQDPAPELTVEAEQKRAPAGGRVADLLRLPLGTVVLQRQFLFKVYGVPQQLLVTYYPLDLVAGTSLDEPGPTPTRWEGVIPELHSIGVKVTAVDEIYGARMATMEESKALQLLGGVPVLPITRRTWAGDRVVEVAVDIVWPGDRVAVHNRTELRWEG